MSMVTLVANSNEYGEEFVALYSAPVTQPHPPGPGDEATVTHCTSYFTVTTVLVYDSMIVLLGHTHNLE